MIELLIRYAPAFLQGAGVTAFIAVVVWVVGIVAGVAVGAAASRSAPILLAVLKFLALAVGAIPILVLLMWLHYPAQAILGVVIDPLLTTIVALCFVNTVFVADAVQRVIGNFPQEWGMAARASGLPAQVTLHKIVLPLAARQLVGPIVLIQITMLHATLFGSLISVGELFRTVQRINAIEYLPVELYTFLAVFFFIICAPLHVVATALSRRYASDLSLR